MRWCCFRSSTKETCGPLKIHRNINYICSVHMLLLNKCDKQFFQGRYPEVASHKNFSPLLNTHGTCDFSSELDVAVGEDLTLSQADWALPCRYLPHLTAQRALQWTGGTLEGERERRKHILHLPQERNLGTIIAAGYAPSLTFYLNVSVVKKKNLTVNTHFIQPTRLKT